MTAEEESFLKLTVLCTILFSVTYFLPLFFLAQPIEKGETLLTISSVAKDSDHSLS